MKSELNNYNIKNPDGADKVKYNEGKIFYDNDNLNFISENTSAKIDETAGTEETSDGRSKISDSKPSQGNSVGDNTSVGSSSSAASSATSVASSVGGSMGAIAGTVATSVAAAAVVVAAFISTLTINISLVLATMTGFVFQVELSGAQEEDFINPIVAVLEGEDGVYREQEIHIDSVYITFDDLEPAKEYVITIKNEEKIFVKKSFFTASENVEKGNISAKINGDEVAVSVENVSLKKGEYYTVVAKDDKGNVLFAKDDVEPNKDFAFSLAEPTDVYFTLSVGGKTYAVSELKLRTAQYDYESGVWSWSDDYSRASIAFNEIHGGEPLIFDAEISVDEVEPSCETDGQTVYLATVNYNEKQYFDNKTIVRAATGHEYGEPEFIWEQEPTGGYSVVAVFVCNHDREHVMTLPATVRQDGDTFYVEVEYDKDTYYTGELPAEYDYANPVWLWAGDFTWASISFAEIHDGESLDLTATITATTTDATCETDGRIDYTATAEYDGQTYEDEQSKTLTAPGHDYSVNFEWEQVGNGYDAKARYVCRRDESHSGVVDANISTKDGAYFAEIQLDGKTYRATYGNISLSLNNGNIILYADGYKQNGVFTAFENTADNRYIISGSRTDDTPLKFDTRTHDGASVANGVNYYVDFDGATIKASSWASAVVVNVYTNVNIDINNYGTTNINPHNHPAFSLQDNKGYYVNISWSNKNGGTFTYSRKDGNNSTDDPALYNENGNTVSFYIDGTRRSTTGAAQ